MRLTYDTPGAPHADLKLCLAKGTQKLCSSREGWPIFPHRVIARGHSVWINILLQQTSQSWQIGDPAVKKETGHSEYPGQNAGGMQVGTERISQFLWMIQAEFRICKRGLDFSYWPEIKRDTCCPWTHHWLILFRFRTGPIWPWSNRSSQPCIPKKVSMRFWRTTRSCWRCLPLFCSNRFEGTRGYLEVVQRDKFKTFT